MQEIRLPLTRCLRLGAWGLTLCGGMLALSTPAPWSWRLGSALLVLASGGLSWRRHCLRRPVALRAYPGGGLACALPDGTEVTVHRLELGVVRPWLVSARLRTAGGLRLHLFVPACASPEDAHWRLRRALLAFRPGHGDDAGVADRRDGAAP